MLNLPDTEDEKVKNYLNELQNQINLNFSQIEKQLNEIKSGVNNNEN